MTMNIGTPLSRLVRLCCALASSVGLTVGSSPMGLSSPARAQTSDYKPAEAAPDAWREFAIRMQSRFREQLASDDGSVRQLNRLLELRRTADSGPLNVMAKVWVSPVGAVERLEFDTLDVEAAASLRDVLIGRSLRMHPPSNMLQPVHVMLSLGQAN